MIVKRTKLHQQLPLVSPFSIHIFPTYKCNFKCNYCIHGMTKVELEAKNFKKEHMSFDTYKKVIDQAKEYTEPLKALIFAGHGEPLMNPNIAQMVAYAKKNDIAQRVEITTNGSLLTPKLSDELIHAGIDRLKISIQGTSTKKYQDIAKYNINFEKFLSNLEYFHQHKKHTEVYIKIIDIALEDKADEEKFKIMFQDKCNYLDIEYAIPFVKEIKQTIYNKEFDRCKQGHFEKSNICSMPFYMQVIAPNGDILPCCSTDIPIVLGNIHETTLKKIWDGQKLNCFLQLMLKDRAKNHICKLCSVPEFGLQEGDYLDDYADNLLQKYSKVINES